jgi:hypothetical protein
MKSIEKLAIVLIVFLFLTEIPYTLSYRFIYGLYGSEAMESVLTLLVYGLPVIKLLIRIAVGIWLFIQAKRDDATPWVWLLFGLVTGLLAAALFYIIKVYEAVKPAEIVENPQPNN